MRFLALATDYDGTLAHHGDVAPATIRALEKLRPSGRKLILVTGRELQDLLSVLPCPELFDRIVAENGALLYQPDTREEQVLVPPPPPQFLRALRERGVQDLSAGRVIVASQELYANVMLLSIRDLGLELQLIFNKGAVMALPSGVNKATGLHAALASLKLSPHNVVGVGDAENDHAFMDVCGCAVAVANALPAIREKADMVTRGDHGVGVTELIEELLATDLAPLADRLDRHALVMGHLAHGQEFRIPAHDTNVLVAGSSGGGKSTLVNGFIERLLEQKYQALILDPEGDYPEIEGALILGSGSQAPSRDEVIGALEKPGRTVVANLIAIPQEDRPLFVQSLLQRLPELRTQTGRPHWIVLDEAHHIFPNDARRPAPEVPAGLHALMIVTVDPQHIHPSVLSRIDRVLVVGRDSGRTLQRFCTAAGRSAPPKDHGDLPRGDAVAWRPGMAPTRFRSLPTRSTRRRHVRKYARGELNEADSFYFEGPGAKLRLRAHNLHTFLELADGVDDETWQYHLHNKDYSDWIRTVLKDDELAGAVARTERATNLSARASRQAVREEIESRYTAPE